MNLVIYHSADYDGLFSGAVAKKFFGKLAKYKGWNYGEEKIDGSKYDNVYVIDLNPECLEKWEEYEDRVIWIDHHKSAMETYPEHLRGIRLDGVSACRLAYQYFYGDCWKTKQEYVGRKVREPEALTLVGEYDVWDKTRPQPEYFQFGLQTRYKTINDILPLLEVTCDVRLDREIVRILREGEAILKWQAEYAADIAKSSGFIVDFEGLKLFNLVSPHARSSLWFPEGSVPDEADAVSVVRIRGNRDISVSLYSKPGGKDIDLSAIAKKYGGGGHRGACGFSLYIGEILKYGFLGV